MRRPARLLLLSLAAALYGPLLGYAPTARAGFVADRIASPPLNAEAVLPGFDPGCDLGSPGADALGCSTTSADLTFDRLPAPPPAGKDGRLLVWSFLPFRAGSGAGSAGGTTTGGPSGVNGGPTTATLPSASSAPPDESGVLLALQEASFLPPAFPSRLFRPPRRA